MYRSFRDRMSDYDDRLINSRFAGRPSYMGNDDYEMGTRARDSRWRARSTTRARDLYHMEDKEQYPDITPSVSSRSRYTTNRSANSNRHESRRNVTSSRRNRSPEYNSSLTRGYDQPSESRSSHGSCNASYPNYGTIPTGYEPSNRRTSTRPVGVLDRFDDDDAESIRSNYSSWSAYRRATTEPESDVRYGLHRLQYSRQIDQTERERARYIPSQGIMGRVSQTGLIPLCISSNSNYSAAGGPRISSSRYRTGSRSSSRANIMDPSDLDWENL